MDPIAVTAALLRAQLPDVPLREGATMMARVASKGETSAVIVIAGVPVTAQLPAEVPAGAPAWPQPDGRVKTSAAWLIERAGYAKGYPGPGGRVALSTKHPLALTNRGLGSTAELLALAREVREGVRARFGITLVNEPVLLGVEL